MIYVFNYQKLDFEPVRRIGRFSTIAISASLVFCYFFFWAGQQSVEPIVVERVETQVHVVEQPISELAPFSEQALKEMIDDLNIRFPHIVFAQAVLETGHFSSPIFLNNNNLFGMKEARVRQNVASGTQMGHACYNTWQESVVDYALYQARYLSHIKTERDYLDYLNNHYAEAQNYHNALDLLIKRLDLRELFA